MKPNKYVAVFSLLNALAFCLTHAPTHAGQANKDAAGRGGQANSHMSSKGAANTNAQWSADPERGWVRADERYEQRDESRPASKAKKNGGKHKVSGAKSHDQKNK
ncbi:MAG TPA: hypothetical protein VI585_27475 [Candidatus Binatia bacterium]